MVFGAFISAVSLLLMIVAGFYHWPIWYIVCGGLLLAFAGITRAFLSANGPLALQTLSYAEALIRGFEQRKFEWGDAKIRWLAVIQISSGVLLSTVLYSVGSGLRGLI